MRNRIPSALLGLLLLAAPARAGDLATDDSGRTFRVAFDPGSQVRLGLLGGLDWQTGPRGDLAVESGVAYRTRTASGEGEDLVSWTLEHRIAWGWLRPLTPDFPAVDATAYAGAYLRHAAEPSLTLPTSPPQRLYFPFDVGTECELGRVRLSPEQPGVDGRPPELRLGVARAGLVLDPWRSGRPGNDLRLVFGVRYDLDMLGDPDLGQPVVRHRLAPFTAFWLRFRWQDEPGLTAFELLADAFPHWSPDAGWDAGAEARARVERVLLALDDQPLSLVAEVSWEHRPAGPGARAWTGRGAGEELRAWAGLSFAFQLKAPNRD